jgi:ribosomal protein S18 acetylase RimI-like enzyme
MIRIAQEKDIEQVTTLCIETAPFEGTGEPGEEEFYNKLFTGSINNGEKLLLVAEADSQIAGFAYAEVQHQPDDCTSAPYVSLDMIGVSESHRGKGIARALMSEVESWVRDKRINIIQLAVAEDNQAAIKLNQSLGYRTVMRKMQKHL